MPTFHASITPTNRSVIFHPLPLTFYGMGDGHNRAAFSSFESGKFLLVLTDYFTRWIEGGAFAKARENKVIDFILRNVICRFGIPKEIVCDNGLQFIGAKVGELLNGSKIKRISLFLYHHGANAQAE